LVPIFIAITASILLWKIDHVRRKHDEISQLKNQFVSIASHELRSPLSGMLWAIQTLLQDKDTTPRQAQILEDMHKSTASSIATVNEILDLSVFERGKVGKIQKVDMDLNAATREVVKNLRLGAAEKHIDLHLSHLAQPAPIHGDPGAIKRSIMNLVSNAIKYSPEGSTIKIAYGHTKSMHSITVKDQGIGIPAKDQKKVLSGYYRSKNAIKVQSTGTGLGLYVTKLMIEQHGGNMSLSSEEGRGTTITIQLPILPKGNTSEPNASQPQQPHQG
jgi:signal transduction histidine kinase